MVRILLAFLALVCALGGSTTDSHGQMIPFAYYRTHSGENDAMGLRFRGSAVPLLSRTPTASGSRTTFTYSAWLKLGAPAVSAGNYGLFSQWGGLSGAWGVSAHLSSGSIVGIVDDWTGSSGGAGSWSTPALLRDPNAWYHIVLVFDTTQASNANRFKAYVNGMQLSTTAGTVYGSFGLNYVTAFGGTSQPMRVGNATTNGSNNNQFDGYMADVNVVDGQALDASAFGYTDPDGMWVPRTYAGPYGTNGFRLDFSDTSAVTATALGKDRAGSNNFTPSNFSITADATFDPILDSPRLKDNSGHGIGNYATWNPLHHSLTYIGNPTAANLNISNASSAGTWPGMGGSMAVSSGKWYYEFAYSGAGSVASSFVGFSEPDISMDSDVTDQPTKIGGWLLRNDSGGLGEAYYNFTGANSFGAGADAPASGTVMLALDMDNNKFWVGRGGTWFNSGNPATGANGISFAAGKTLMPFVSPCCVGSGGSVSFTTNFGQQPFTYTAPAGFKAWNTYNLPAPAITTPSTYLKIATYTGTGSYISIGDPVKLAGSKNIANSLRFRSGASNYLTRTGTLGNRQKWTWSGWIKRSTFGTNQALFSDGTMSYTTLLHFDTSNQLVAYVGDGSSNTAIATKALFMDPAAWHHVVWAVDTTQATSTLRNRLYIDGIEATALVSPGYPAQNFNSAMNNSNTYQLGRNTSGTTMYFDGHMSDVYYLDGQTLTPASFGETDANGNWVPKATSGLTYGTNGFHFDFSDPDIVAGARTSYDSSGNNNNFTPYNFTVPNTAYFKAASSDYMYRTPAAAGNRKTWTFSTWLRRASTPGTAMEFFSAGTSANDWSGIGFDTGNRLWVVRVGPGGGTTQYRATTQTFTSTSGWSHVVVAWDTTQATAADRVKVYVDGTQVSSFTSSTDPAQNYDEAFINTAVAHAIGRNYPTGARFFDGDMGETYFIDGQALTPASFAQTTGGKWVPKAYTGTYGTNGFRTDFADRTPVADLGKDVSGNNNNFTVSAMTQNESYIVDLLRDTPTPYNDGTDEHGNFNTLNPVGATLQGGTMAYGNMYLATANDGVSFTVEGTLKLGSGKWYWEATPFSNGGYGQIFIGVKGLFGGTSTGYWLGNGGTFGFGTYGIAFDGATGKIWIRTGASTWSGGGDPVLGTTPTATAPVGGVYDYTPMGGAGRTSGNSTAGHGIYNFGQRDFYYAPPAGFKAVSTNNTTGGSGFIPDLVITKNRSAAVGWGWYDRLRGATLELDSASTAGHAAASTGLLNFQNGGFTAGISPKFNNSGQNYVSYMFKEGATPGFDIVTHTGNNTGNRALTHSLGAVPKFIVTKRTDAAGDNWAVYHAERPNKYLYLNSITSENTDGGIVWGTSVPTTSDFYVGTSGSTNQSAATYVSYLFSEVPGFSKFGSYVGNGSTDGAFIYTGFKPAFLLTKRIDSGYAWTIFDYARSLTNPMSLLLTPYDSAVEGTSMTVDFLSNGFKWRSVQTSENASGATYIYAAFAEKPFKYTNGR